MALGTPATLGSTVSAVTTNVFTHTTTASVGSGERIFLVAGYVSNAATERTAVTTGGGLTWTEDHNVGGLDGNFGNLKIFSANCPAGLASSTVLTVTLSGNSFGINIGCFSCSGVATASFVDMVDGQFRATPTGTWDSTASSTTNADDLLVGFAFCDGTPTISSTVGGSFTELLDIFSASNDWTLTVTYRIVAATASYNATGTWSGTPAITDWAAITAYKAEPAGPPDPGPALRVVRGPKRL